MSDAASHLQTCDVVLPRLVAEALVEKGFDADVVASKTEQTHDMQESQDAVECDHKADV